MTQHHTLKQKRFIRLVVLEVEGLGAAMAGAFSPAESQDREHAWVSSGFPPYKPPGFTGSAQMLSLILITTQRSFLQTPQPGLISTLWLAHNANSISTHEILGAHSNQSSHQIYRKFSLPCSLHSKTAILLLFVENTIPCICSSPDTFSASCLIPSSLH